MMASNDSPWEKILKGGESGNVEEGYSGHPEYQKLTKKGSFL
jgi:hypothetical protein